MKILLTNKKAFFNYEIGEKYEAGISLTGAEVKSMLSSQASLTGSFCLIRKNEMVVLNMYIAPYQIKEFNSKNDTIKTQKLLLHKNEILKIDNFLKKHRATIIPLKAYINHGKIKLEIGICMKKNAKDKREVIKARDEKRHLRKI